MTAETVTSLLDALFASRLLDRSQLDELIRLPDMPHSSPDEIGDFIQKRGWLTPYQLEQIRQGNGAHLVFGGYRIMDRVGEGDGGIVFRASHPALAGYVTLRWVRPEWVSEADSMSAYIQRAQAASLVSHAHLLNVLDAGMMNDLPFVVMEYIEGTDLGSLIAGIGPMPVQLACEYTCQVAQAMEAAHAKGVPHGDIQPRMIIVTPVIPASGTGSNGSRLLVPAPGAYVKLSELGLVPHRPPIEQLLQRSEPISIDCLPPERIHTPNADVKGDIFSLGACLMFLLTGRGPFTAPSAMETFYRMQHTDPTPIETLRNDLPPSLVALIHRMTVREPNHRLSSMREAAETLLAILQRLAGGSALPPPLAANKPVLMADPVSNVFSSGGTPSRLAPPSGPQTISPVLPAEGVSGVGLQSAVHAPPLHAMPASGVLGDPYSSLHSGPASAFAPTGLQRRENKTGGKSTLWLIIGACFHLAAIVLILLYFFTDFFNESSSKEPETPAVTEPEKPKQTIIRKVKKDKNS